MTETVLRVWKVKVPSRLALRLEDLHAPSLLVARRMLKNRHESSSSFYHEIPCVISKSLIDKYQRNRRCKNIRNLVLPVCGDKGKQIKLVDGGIRVPAIFHKEVLPIVFPLPVHGFIRCVEFFKREGQWYASVCYNTPKAKTIDCCGVVGVDRNSVGNIAVMADVQTGKVLKLGFSPAPTKRAMRGRRSNLQRARKFRLLAKIRRRQRRRMTHENHRVSKSIVNYAAEHRLAVAIENLAGVRKPGSRIRKYSEKNQWAFAQLETFLRYKCALRGIPVIAVNPAYTSQDCSRCGSRHKPSGKIFHCATCGHNSHRDVNAAYNIGARALSVFTTGGSSSGLNVSGLGPIGSPQGGKEFAS